MQREFENGYTVDVIPTNDGFSVYVNKPTGVTIAVKHGMPHEESALFVGEAIADAYLAGRNDGIEHFTDRLRAIIKEYGY